VIALLIIIKSKKEAITSYPIAQYIEYALIFIPQKVSKLALTMIINIIALSLIKINFN